MQRIDGLPKPGAIEGPSVATIGVFDGLHIGHQRLLARVRAVADEESASSVVITFRRHPDAVLRGRAPSPLQSLEDRLDGLERLGMDVCFTLDFDDSVRTVRAEDFLERVLLRGIGCRRLVLGHDSAIGHQREGTAERFRELGLASERVEEVTLDDRPVSASAIRNALALGELEAAYAMLGHRHRVRGCVVHGDARGRTLGIPTANLEVPGLCLPANGVYAAWARAEDFEHPVRAVTNLGIRPSFGGGPQSFEAHLLDDFDASLYGAEIEIEFVARLRDEMRFESTDALVAQIHADIARARECLASNG